MVFCVRFISTKIGRFIVFSGTRGPPLSEMYEIVDGIKPRYKSQILAPKLEGPEMVEIKITESEEVFVGRIDR